MFMYPGGMTALLNTMTQQELEENLIHAPIHEDRSPMWTNCGMIEAITTTTFTAANMLPPSYDMIWTWETVPWVNTIRDRLQEKHERKYGTQVVQAAGRILRDL